MLPFRRDNKPTARGIIIKLQNTKNKDILKANREKKRHKRKEN